LKKFRFFSALLAVLLVLSLVVVGCAPKEEPKGDTAKDEKVTLRFAHWRGEDRDAFNEIAKKFTAENPNITIEQDISNSQQYQTKIQAEVRAQGGPDIFTAMPGAVFAGLLTTQVFYELNGEDFISRVPDQLLLPGQDGDKQYAIPYQLVFNIPVFNKAILEEIGYTEDKLPKDWAGFLEMAEKIKAKGITPIIFDSEIGPGQFINPMLMNNMPEDDTLSKVETGETKLTDEWFVKTLEQFKELNDKGYFQKDVLGTKKAGAAALFAQGKGALLAQGSYMMATNKEANPDLKQGLYAPITVPADKMKYEGIHTATFMIGLNKNSKNLEAAKKFMEFLFRPEIAADYAKATGQMLTIKDVKYESEELAAQTTWLDKKTLFQPRYTLKITEVSKATLDAVTDVIGGMSPEDAAQKAQAEVERALKNK